MGKKRAVDGKRVCVSCKEALDDSEFSFRSDHPHLKVSQCKFCENARTRYKTSVRVDIVNYLKVDEGCADCGYNAYPQALDYDHLPGTVKKYNVGEMVRHAPWDVILEEIEKCEVVCANCHRVRTWKRANGMA